MILEFPHFAEVRSADWPWANFKPIEIASRGDGSIRIESDAMDALQELRDRLGTALRINSAYRDPVHNARVGGAPRSAHKMGLAFDLAIGRHDRHYLYDLAKRTGFAGFGFYRTFLHVDVSRARHWYGGGGKAAWS